jgi:hypothetical protein
LPACGLAFSPPTRHSDTGSGPVLLIVIHGLALFSLALFRDLFRHQSRLQKVGQFQLRVMTLFITGNSFWSLASRKTAGPAELFTGLSSEVKGHIQRVIPVLFGGSGVPPAVIRTSKEGCTSQASDG